MRSLDHNISKILVFVLFSNIYYLLVGILYVFATYAARYACITKRGNLLDNKTKPV